MHKTASRYQNKYNKKPRTYGYKRRRRVGPIKRFIEDNLYTIALTALPLAALLIGIGLTAGIMNFRSGYLTRDYGRELRYTTYTVKSGDTMWSIAQDMSALNPEFPDMRAYLYLLQKTNHNYGDKLVSGTQILIPYYESATGRDFLSIYERYGIDVLIDNAGNDSADNSLYGD